ncbi:hypothetical protein PFICI_03183 [Pestalotiopsis fici W106-1]|uniref:Uncharacterized protein n=1 Tax=Pestalotiopsis fici (strain W106-1 / CGMCC3.15140) TaxID=1229662 RepID=W3XGD5_PESFW|nr:uncharacterized protein PFICI_03183 [Pestalotiopsis fici W106-1]ETS85158.1 hypothetical protein PFICI_03183 [Pestalotiopsis fici W106-1]
MNYSPESLGLDTEDSESTLWPLFHLLDSCARSEGTSTPAWAAQGIQQCCQGCPEEHLGGFLFGFWGLLLDLVREIDVDHPAMDLLAEVVAELKKLPSIKVNVHNEEKLLWTDLPVLEMELLERFTAHEYGDASLIKEYQDEHIRINSFAARLLPLGLSSTRPTEALEYTLEREPCMDWDLEAASEYILRAGNTIFEHLDDPRFTELGYEGGPLYTGTKGVNMERWNFWKKRFRECGEAASPDSKAHQKALEASRKMDIIEAQAEH